MKKRNRFFLLPLALFFASCEPEFKDQIVFEPGDADFRSYVAIGNSLTAGFQSNALSREGQLNSYPFILAEQFSKVEDGMLNFNQPLMAEGVGVGPQGNAKLILTVSADCKDNTSLTPKPAAPNGQVDQFNPASVKGEKPFRNLGVPGAKTAHIVTNNYAMANPFYNRFVNPNNNSESILAAAIRANPTFYSLWIGNNDVLGYVTSGGEGDAITDQSVFELALNQIIDSLKGNNAKGVIANIPALTSLPFVTTIPWNGLLLENQQDVDNLNNAYAAYNVAAASAGIDPITFKLGANAFVIEDPSVVVGGIRQIKSHEYVTLGLSLDSVKCGGYGSQKAIPDAYTLDAIELQEVTNAIFNFNEIIETMANQNGLALVDAYSLIKEFENGVAYDGINYSTTFVTGGMFSLDGVHPNSRGHAIIANAHIDAINDKFNANVPKVNVNDFSGVFFPNLD